MLALRKGLLWLAILGGFTVFGSVSLYRIIPAEYAVILYDYSRNLAYRGIITYGNATTPIEGATDFLWMLLIAVLKRVGVDEFASALLLNTGAALGILYLCYKRSRRDLLVLAACTMAVFATPYLYSSAVGFSTLFFSLIFVLLTSLVTTVRAYLFYLVALLFCLVRPDGLVWSIGLNFIRVATIPRTDLRGELKAGFVALAAPGLLYFLWRL